MASDGGSDSGLYPQIWDELMNSPYRAVLVDLSILPQDFHAQHLLDVISGLAGTIMPISPPASPPRRSLPAPQARNTPSPIPLSPLFTPTPSIVALPDLDSLDSSPHSTSPDLLPSGSSVEPLFSQAPEVHTLQPSGESITPDAIPVAVAISDHSLLLDGYTNGGRISNSMALPIIGP